MKKLTIKILAVLWCLALTFGIVGLSQKFSTGERLAGYGSYVPWGLWVAIYFHMIGIAGGIFSVGVLGYFLGIKGLRKNLPLTIFLSLGALVTGFLSIGLDIGRMERFYRILTDPSFTSMLAFNAWMYGFFMTAALVSLFLYYKSIKSRDGHRHPWLVPLLMAGLAMSLAYPSQSGSLFGVVNAKPYWESALLPFMFLASAVASGAAVLLLWHTFLLPENISSDEPILKYLRRILIGGVAVYLGAEFAEFSVGLWSPASHVRESLFLVMFGPFWWVFWIVHLGGAGVALFLLFQRKMYLIGTGAFLVAVTFVSARLNILIPGQSMEQLHGLKEAFHHQRLSYYYQATLNEYLVALFLGAFCVGLMFLGIKASSLFIVKEAK